MRIFFSVSVLFLMCGCEATEFAFFKLGDQTLCNVPSTIRVNKKTVKFEKIIHDYMVNASYTQVKKKVVDSRYPGIILIQYDRWTAWASFGHLLPDGFEIGASTAGVMTETSGPWIGMQNYSWCYMTYNVFAVDPYERVRNVSIIFDKWHPWTEAEIIRVLNLQVPLAQKILDSQ